MEASAEANLPQRVGRYDVLGRLETGGMAEILLGQLRGPSGFEAPVKKASGGRVWPSVVAK